MRTIFKTILDSLTFTDIAGKRHWRVYSVLTLVILILLTTLGGCVILERNLTMSAVRATPRPVEVSETVPAQPTPVFTQQFAQPAQCPTNPQDWFLADVPVSQNYKLIQPACVYDGLAHSVAWVLAVRQGFSRAEANTALGFVQIPLKRLDTVTILDEKQEKQAVAVSFIAPHPEFTEWRIDSRGESSIAYGLRGCFRTSEVVGNHMETWGGDYPVICIVVEDAIGTQVVYALNGHTFTSPATPTRSFLLFGYAGDGQWFWLGAQADPKLTIDNPIQIANERLTVATLYDAQPWDVTWLASRYHLTMRPLPENWQSKTKETDQQAIVDALNSFLSEVQP